MATDRLLQDAVRDGERRGYGADRLDDLFALLFRGLVYAQIWEDPKQDAEVMDLGPGHRVVAIGSGGCNAMSYLLSDPAEVVAVDLNRGHVALTRLKAAAARHLEDHEDFFRLFGHAADRRNVALFDERLAHLVDAETRAYWGGRAISGTRRINAFRRGLYRQGLLGRFITLLHAVIRLHGRNPRRVLEARTAAEQRARFEDTLAPVLDGWFVRAACRLPIALYGLGIPPAQFRALADCAHGDLPRLLRERVERLVCGFPLADNWFAWQAFGRSYDTERREAVPPYLRRSAWSALQGRADRLDVRRASITDYLQTRPARSVDRFVLLDAQDWMNERQLGALWAEIARTAAPGARVLFRTGAEASPVEAVLPADERRHWHYDAAAARERVTGDRSAIYGGVHLYERVAP
jgi:S-adenosylmethionine-diacylglycerol 3-amino-3-carboxypropyl transferase